MEEECTHCKVKFKQSPFSVIQLCDKCFGKLGDVLSKNPTLTKKQKKMIGFKILNCIHNSEKLSIQTTEFLENGWVIINSGYTKGHHNDKNWVHLVLYE